MANLLATEERLETPRDFVQSGWNYQRSLGNTWRDYALDQLARLNAITISPMTFETPVDLNLEFGTFTRPVSPTRPTLPSIDVDMPSAPALVDVTVPTIPDAPAEPDFTGLAYQRPTAPNRAAPVRPTVDDVALEPITIPQAPTLDLPADPTLYTLTLPPTPDIVIPEFIAQRPVRDFGAPSQVFAYTPAQFDRTMIDSIKQRLGDIFAGGLGLPAHIEDQLFDRGRGRASTIAVGAIRAAETDMAARGLRHPAGLLAARIDQVRGEARQEAHGVNRDLTIRAAELQVENMRFALTQAISLEISLLQSHNAENELSLRAAQAAQAVSIDLYNARVALFAAEWDGFRAEAQAFESRIRALQSEVEIYRTQIEAEKTKGDVNESLVRAYAERMRARNALIEIYRAQLDGARLVGEVNSQKLQQQRQQIEIFAQDVDAYAKEWDAYRINVEAESGNLRALQTLGEIHRVRTDTWRTRNQAYFDEARLKIETQEQRLARFRTELQAATTESQLKLSELDGLLRTYSTDAQVFAAEGQLSAAESAAADRTVEQRLAAGRLRIETTQNNLRLAADYAMKGIDALIAIKRGQADIVAQLAASSQSGVNFGASYSGSLGWSYGRSASWSGEAPDGPDF